VSGAFTVSNTGGTAVTNGSAVVTGGPFVIVSGSAVDVPPGASVDVVVDFTPSTPGAFTNAVIFTAGSFAATNSLTGTAAVAPVADFSATPVEGLLPLTVTFTDASTGSIDDREWMFGDGTTSMTTSPTHTYTNSGVFTVRLKVVGPLGTDTVTKKDLITVVDTNLFVRLAGTYYGLSLGETQTFANSGFVILKIGATGAVNGTFQQGKARSSFAGMFNPLGHAAVTIPRPGQSMLTANLHLDGSGSDQVTGTVTEAGLTATLVADRAVFGKTTPSPLAGHRYTLLLAADTTNTLENVPQGDGFGTVLIKAPGTVQVSGVTGDGQKFKQKVPISKYGTWPLYVPLYGGLGAVFGWVTHSNIVAVSDLDGSLHWSKPSSPADALYPAGFADNIGLVGSEYVRPLPGRNVIAVSDANDNALVTFGLGGLPSIQRNLVTLTAGNVVLSTNLTLKITTSTGLFKGSFRRAENGSRVRFQGAILQKQNFGSGLFLGTNESGFVTFEPASP
jgi:PKD repeat protein